MKMNKDQFISTLILMGFKRNGFNTYVNGIDKVSVQSNFLITTIKGISAYHNSFNNAIKRLTKK